jgi:hypothetical protein
MDFTTFLLVQQARVTYEPHFGYSGKSLRAARPGGMVQKVTHYMVADDGSQYGRHSPDFMDRGQSK